MDPSRSTPPVLPADDAPPDCCGRRLTAATVSFGPPCVHGTPGGRSPETRCPTQTPTDSGRRTPTDSGHRTPTGFDHRRDCRRRSLGRTSVHRKPGVSVTHESPASPCFPGRYRLFSPETWCVRFCDHRPCRPTAGHGFEVEVERPSPPETWCVPSERLCSAGWDLVEGVPGSEVGLTAWPRPEDGRRRPTRSRSLFHRKPGVSPPSTARLACVSRGYDRVAPSAVTSVPDPSGRGSPEASASTSPTARTAHSSRTEGTPSKTCSGTSGIGTGR